ncbi:hypothetical protein D3C86_2045440 [compost metagenome]
MYEIKDRGIYYWNENIKLITELDKLNLPEVLHERNATLKEYCELRIKCYELIYKGVQEGDKNKYEAEMQPLAKRIEHIIKTLHGETK